VSPEQVRYCYSLLGREKPDYSLLPLDHLLPKNDIFRHKRTNFELYPGIILVLAAFGQNNVDMVLNHLQLLYPNEPMPEGFKTAPLLEIRDRIQAHIFPLLKNSLFPVLQNFAMLNKENLSHPSERFGFLTAMIVLDVILHHEFFREIPKKWHDTIKMVRDNLKPTADDIVQADNLSDFESSDLPDLPDVVKDLIAALANAPRTYLPSGGHTVTRYCRSEERESRSDVTNCVTVLRPVH
jgi:hypothetical protein